MYTPDLLLASIIAVTMRTNEMVTKKVMLPEAIATGTTMFCTSIGTWVTGIEQKVHTVIIRHVTISKA